MHKHIKRLPAKVLVYDSLFVKNKNLKPMKKKMLKFLVLKVAVI